MEAGAAALEAGGILVHPTETVYGLGAGPRELDDEIARLKGRPPDRPLLRVAADVEALRRAHPELEWDGRARELGARFWPGPLTLVLPDGSGSGLGVRVEGHSLLRAVLREWGGTMSSTSLNLSGEEPARTTREARDVLDAMPEAEVDVTFLDAGDLSPSPPSTVVSLTGVRPRLLREGAVGREALEECLGGPLETGGETG